MAIQLNTCEVCGVLTRNICKICKKRYCEICIVKHDIDKHGTTLGAWS